MPQQTQGFITDPVIAARTPSKLLGILGMVWLTFLLVLVFTQLKTFAIGPVIFSVGVITYPFTYIFADIFTEVYGYRVSRRVVWTGFVCALIASFVAYVYSSVPASASFELEEAFDLIFRMSPVIAIATILGFSGGEFMNSYVLARLKVHTGGQYMWLRLIGSTVAGQFVDNGTFFTVSFLAAGIFSAHELPSLILSSAAFCTIWETLALPVTYRVIRAIKRFEGLDAYDRGTNFNPFLLR